MIKTGHDTAHVVLLSANSSSGNETEKEQPNSQGVKEKKEEELLVSSYTLRPYNLWNSYQQIKLKLMSTTKHLFIHSLQLSQNSLPIINTELLKSSLKRISLFHQHPSLPVT